METTINLSGSSNQLAELLALIHLGNEVVVQENNIPIARIVPIQPQQPVERRQIVFGLFAGKIHVPDDFDEPLPESFWLGES